MTIFKDDEVTIHRNIIGDELLRFLQNHLVNLLDRFPYSICGDPQVPNSRAKGVDWHMENLADFLLPSIEKDTGLKLFPTYTYFREYGKGDQLFKHVDRSACEISMSLCIKRNKTEPIWPLCCKTKSGEHIEALLEEGDALIYNGLNIQHWRDPLVDGTYQLNVFIHYVNQVGIHRAEKFDRRLHTYKPQQAIASI